MTKCLGTLWSGHPNHAVLHPFYLHLICPYDSTHRLRKKVKLSMQAPPTDPLYAASHPDESISTLRPTTEDKKKMWFLYHHYFIHGKGVFFVTQKKAYFHSVAFATTAKNFSETTKKKTPPYTGKFLSGTENMKFWILVFFFLFFFSFFL